MNLEESTKIYQKNKRKNAKKQTIMGGIIVCIIIMILCFMAIFYLNTKEANRFKYLYNGKEISINSDFIVEDEEKNPYINIKQLASLLEYDYNQGDYIEVNEDKNSCYIKNAYEIVSFKADQKSFTKYIINKGTNLTEKENSTNEESNTEKNSYVVKSEDGTKEEFVIDLPIRLIEEQLYIPMDILNVACNLVVSKKDKSLQIYSLDQLVLNMQQYATSKGYDVLSNIYENIRTIPNNMVVVGKNDLYGVISLETGESILSIKYDDIQYIQNENKFYVYVDSKVGIMDTEGNTIISPKDYESIEVFDNEKGLFLVEKVGKYGLLNKSADTVLHTDFDGIGILDLESYNLENLRNKNIWYDEIIAVKKGTKYGLYSIEKGEAISGFNYDGFGYKTTSTDKAGEESILLIPKETGIEGIVVQNDGLYGIYDVKIKDQVIPCSCTRIYSITQNGVSTYYMEFNGTQLEMKKYFEDHNMVTVR